MEKQGKFELKLRKNSHFMFNLVATNNEVVLTSEGYTTKENAKKGIEAVRKNSQITGKFLKLVDLPTTKVYFVLKAENGEIIGRSQMYVDDATRKTGIAAVKKYAPTAALVDKTV
ncbi:MAG: YegP family protein [Candidatus Symbiothrix sp.]|nr:YegP family protein [Candidatus Symbiothrix sp.]